MAVGDPDGDARCIEKPRSGLGDPLQRSLRIAGSVGDRAQDVRAGVLTVPRDAQLVVQPGIFLRGHGLPGDGLIVRGKTGFQSLLKLGHQPVEIGYRVLGKRRHSINPLQSVCPTPCGQELNSSRTHAGLTLMVTDYSIPDASGLAPSRLFLGREGTKIRTTLSG